MQWAWHFSEEAGSLAAGAGEISFDVTTGKMVSAAAGDTIRSSRPSRITMQLAFAVAIVVFSVSGLDMMSFGCDGDCWIEEEERRGGIYTIAVSMFCMVRNGLLF